MIVPRKTRKRLRRRLVVLPMLFAAGIAIGYHFAREPGLRLTAYVAKQTCSLVNISNRPMEEVLSELREDNPYLKYVEVERDSKTGETKASVLGLFPNSAIYRPPLGAVLVFPNHREKINKFPLPEMGRSEARGAGEISEIPRIGDRLVDALGAAQAYAFAEPTDGKSKRRTRAILVILDNQVVLEAYGNGATAETLQLGWSMSKSVLNLAIGRRIFLHGDEANLSLEADGLRPEWQDDERRKIRLEQLLRMESGLEFGEPYSLFSDSITMLYREPDMAAYAASFHRAPDAGENPRYGYSSGSSNILSDQLRRSFGGDDRAYVKFMWDEFLVPLGIETAQLEFDASGTWVASSYLYATARDWARFGKLVLDNGKWDRAPFLPDDWIGLSTRPTKSYHANPETGDPPGASYGMHWWLNQKDTTGNQWMPEVPEDAVSAWGHFGQFVTIIPSRQMIVVRLGSSRGPQGWDHNFFLKTILDGFPGESLHPLDSTVR